MSINSVRNYATSALGCNIFLPHSFSSTREQTRPKKLVGQNILREHVGFYLASQFWLWN